MSYPQSSPADRNAFHALPLCGQQRQSKKNDPRSSILCKVMQSVKEQGMFIVFDFKLLILLISSVLCEQHSIIIEYLGAFSRIHIQQILKRHLIPLFSADIKDNFSRIHHYRP